MTLIPILLILLISIATLYVVIFLKPKKSDGAQLASTVGDTLKSISKIELGLKEEFRLNREENLKVSKENREELNSSLKDLKKELAETLKNIIEQNSNNLKEVNLTLDKKLQLLAEHSKDNNVELRNELEKSLKGVQENFDKNFSSFNTLQKEKFEILESKQSELILGTEKKLEEMRATVDEKLQKTLNERLGQSFEAVGKQLKEVQEGLGEMRTLATDVGGLKKVLSNVKMRGGLGEVQLSMLLEQIMAPSQYEANIKTKSGSKDLVEFAIKLPGKEEGLDQVWLPIDAKFPKDYYEQLQVAYDVGEKKEIELAQKNLENAVRGMAEDISSKYIDPPNTTDFAIMFLPFEGIYAEVVRKASLLEDLQKKYKVIIAGPSTLAALLSSLQMGFKTLAIQKSSSEVWKVLGGVKAEFEKFGGLLAKSRKSIQSGLDDLDDLVGTRSNMIRRQLKNVESAPDVKIGIPEILGGDAEEEL